MKRASLLVVGCAVLGTFAVPSSAGAYSTPKQAKRAFSELVVAYNQCTAPTLTHRPSLAFPACPPAQSSANNPANVLSFASFGALSLDFKAKSGDISLKVVARGIYRNGAAYSGNLVGTTLARVTDNGCGPQPYNDDCTVSDFPVPASATCINSFCFATGTTVNAVLPGALNSGDRANIEFGQFAVADPDGDTFARGGLLVL